MRVLVVGGAGYVGGAVVDKLIDDGHHVMVYDALLYEESYRKEVPFKYGDIRDTATLKPFVEWADTVIWLAALVGDGACALNPEVTYQVNQAPVEWLSKNFDGRIIFTSTCSVYGFSEIDKLNEQSPLNPLSVYATTKLEAESYLKNKNALVFRLGTLFGVGDLYSRIRLDLVVNTMTARACKQGHISVFGGDQFRPLLHVLDVAKAIAENVDTEATGIYNIHKQNVRISDLAMQIRNHFPDLQIESKEIFTEDSRSYRVDSTKAKTELGFNPVCSIDQGIEEVKNLIEDNRIKDLSCPRYTNHGYLSMYSTHILEK
jgi:nucleoside-diphosphate-sugar epimerase